MEYLIYSSIAIWVILTEWLLYRLVKDCNKALSHLEKVQEGLEEIQENFEKLKLELKDLQDELKNR